MQAELLPALAHTLSKEKKKRSWQEVFRFKKVFHLNQTELIIRMKWVESTDGRLLSHPLILTSTQKWMIRHVR